MFDLERCIMQKLRHISCNFSSLFVYFFLFFFQQEIWYVCVAKICIVDQESNSNHNNEVRWTLSYTKSTQCRPTCTKLFYGGVPPNAENDLRNEEILIINDENRHNLKKFLECNDGIGKLLKMKGTF